MNSSWTTVQRALDGGCRLGLALGLMALFLTSTLGLSIPVHASGQSREVLEETVRLQGGDPAARVQVIIKSIAVANDRDGFWTGAGGLYVEGVRLALLGWS
jgi:hypothetical protein